MRCLNQKCLLNKNKECQSDQVSKEGAYCKSRDLVTDKPKISEFNKGEL